MKGGYILLNGRFNPENEPVLKSFELQNFKEGIKESFRAENNEVLFGEENYHYFLEYLSDLNLPLPNDWDLPRFRKDVSRLLNKNHHFLAAKITIYFYKGIQGTDYLLTTHEIERGFYPINDTGLLTDFFNNYQKNESPLNQYENSCRFLWNLANLSRRLNSRDNLFISNSKGFICECIEGSFGFFQNNILHLPSLYSGGYYPPIVNEIEKQAKVSGFAVKKRANISRNDLLDAEEVFLIDNCLGIQKILGLANRRYYSAKTTFLANELKERVRMSLERPNSR